MSQYAEIKFNNAVLRGLDQASVRALPMTGTAVLKDMKKAQVIPLDTSHLQNDSTFVDDSQAALGHVDIVSSTPYARRLYYHPEYNFHQEPWTDKSGKTHTRANAHAGAHWFDPWMDGGEREDFAQKAFSAAYKKEAGV